MLPLRFLIIAVLFLVHFRGPICLSEDRDPSSLLVQEIEIIGRSETLLSEAGSAAEGVVGQAQLAARPILRPAEILESVPGLITSQHSGSGKANQYYLRGFNLDHGTDFLTSLDGMPINLPTHAHGQGYTDLNFLIPELVESISYRKGPYYAEKGDFSSAGSADMHLFDELDSSILSFTGGKDDYYRALAAGSPEVGEGHLLYGLETTAYDGPWDNSENLGKVNGVLRYSQGDERNGASITGLAYHNEWDATDQIPRRAVDQGIISYLGTIDPTDGGNTSRFSLLGSWRESDANESTKINLYSYYYRLNLFSNFTYFLDDPVNGDQFEQAERRFGTGGDVSHQWGHQIFGRDSTETLGFQVRRDSIPQIGLFHTKGKGYLSTTRDDEVTEMSGALYGQSETQWLQKMRTMVGLRGDLYHFDVKSNLDANSGEDTAGIVNPKFGITFGPWARTELYFNAGSGFHSNDARGTTITIDPQDPTTPATRVDPLARSKGAEIGVRTAIIPGLVSTISLWDLDLDSELLFIGDAGSTEASRPSRRHGVEFANYYKANDWLAVDADVSLSRAQFRDSDPAGDHIPGSVESVFATGLTMDQGLGLFSNVRLRYFGPRSLIEDDSVRSNSTALVNARAGYHFQPIGPFKTVTLALDALNLFNSHDSDIDYYYASRLPGEAGDGRNDIHSHPSEPAEYRVTLALRF